VTVTVKARTVTVKGPRGTLERAFKTNNFAATMLGKKALRVEIWFGKRDEISCLRTHLLLHVMARDNSNVGCRYF